MLIVAPHRAAETVEFIAVLIMLLFYGAIIFVVDFLFFFWPLLLYFGANVNAVRQQTFLTLIQTAIETGKPLQDIVRAYAIDCSSRYATQLKRFAESLDAGLPLEDAVRVHRGLFRFDVAGMIRLGGDASETLRNLETVAEDERNFAAIRTNSIIRVVYLCTLVANMLPILAFIFINVVPSFEMLFREFDSNLPPLTAEVVAASQWCVLYWYILALPIPFIALAALAYLVLQTNVVVYRPFGFRRMFRSTDSAKFLMLFAVGVRHRFPIPAILEMYRETVPSDYLRSKGTKIQQAVERGHDWIGAVCNVGFVSEPEASLLQSAQRTGNTAAVLDQLALSKERSQIRKNDLISKLAFIPLLFLFGAIIGVVTVALFLPLVSMISVMSGW
jgi:type IV pilus assembly protein PilC